MWLNVTFSVLDMNCSCRICDQCTEYHLDELREQLREQEQDEIEDMKYDLENDFPDFQDDTCKAILGHVCTDLHGPRYEGQCCLRKRRRIMDDAQPIAEAWESAENLKKLFRNNSLIPKHFVLVCRFLK